MRIDTQQGLTLPELLISLTLISTLSMNAYSQFSHILQENRMASEVNLFMTALHLTRNEAIKHGRRIVLCPSRDGAACGNATDWVSGWILFASDDREHDNRRTGPAKRQPACRRHQPARQQPPQADRLPAGRQQWRLECLVHLL